MKPILTGLGLLVSRDVDSPVVSSTTNPATPSHFGSPASGLGAPKKEDCSSAVSSSSSDSESDLRENSSVELPKPAPQCNPQLSTTVTSTPLLTSNSNIPPPTTSMGILNAYNCMQPPTTNPFQML